MLCQLAIHLQLANAIKWSRLFLSVLYDVDTRPSCYMLYDFQSINLTVYIPARNCQVYSSYIDKEFLLFRRRTAFPAELVMEDHNENARTRNARSLVYSQNLKIDVP